MKPIKIKAWPELMDFLPCLPALTDSRRQSSAESGPVEVDFSLVRTVSSTGLTIFLLQLLRLLGKHRVAILRQEGEPEILEELNRLGAFRLLADLAGSLQPKLQTELSLHDKQINSINPIFRLPIYKVHFTKTIDPRKTVNVFTKWLSENIPPLTNHLNLHCNGLVMLLNEIAKNTADHAQEDALFGFDVFPLANNSYKLTFAFGDFGIGIKRHISEHLPPELHSRIKHMSLYEAYRLAVQPGYTSNRLSGLNKGHGMSIIIDIASDLGLHLSVFDAWSRGLLTLIPNVQSPTHEAIRRIFQNVGHDVGFFYYGELHSRP